MTNRNNTTNPFPLARSAPVHTANTASTPAQFLPEIHQWLGDVKGIAEAVSLDGAVDGSVPTFVGSTRERTNEVGPITDFFILNRGSGYTSTPSISIVDGGIGAEITFSTRGDTGGFHGEIAEATIVSGGRGYTSGATITLPAPDQTVGETNPPTRGVQATATLTSEDGVITAVTITERGAGYNPGAVTYNGTIVDDGPGRGATATVSINAGIVSSFTRGAFGTARYTSKPTVTISGGGGSGCQVDIVVSEGVILEMNVVDGGTGYTSAPTVTVTGGGASGTPPVWTANITRNVLSNPVLTSGGTGYVSPRTVIAGENQSGLLAVVQGVVTETQVNQFRMQTTKDEPRLFSRFVPTQATEPGIYTAPLTDASVSQYLTIALDYNEANVYFFDLLQRTQSYTIVTRQTVEADGTTVTRSSAEGISFSATIDIKTALDIDFGESELSLDEDTIIGTLGGEDLRLSDFVEVRTSDLYGSDVPSQGQVLSDIVSGLTFDETGKVSFSVENITIGSPIQPGLVTQGTQTDRGTFEPYDGDFESSSGGSPSAPPGPRPGGEPPIRGGVGGQGYAHSGPSGAGATGQQATETRRGVNVPLQYFIDAPLNMTTGQSIDVFLRHYVPNISEAHAPIFTFGRKISPGFSVRDYRPGTLASAGVPQNGLASLPQLENGVKYSYQVNNEIVGIRITKIDDNTFTADQLGVWPNKRRI